MSGMKNGTRWSLTTAAVVGMAFGLLTIISGGNALFGREAAREAVGNAVPFVVWFNFAAGLVYIIAGIGLLFRRRWGLWTSVAIVAATALVFGAFAVHVLQGGLYDMRTVGAMALRTGVWLIIAIVARWALPGR
ncbi:hypothetical protein PZ897_01665 [Hoeflea sp. YIM 152468]|uniref:hypothetical protein n=1 Tax=Hoeflea sp. YIM 152468 TaxID=3031759 RepID=UPI0023DC2741|nr:hypothetical protein [Hoeflea sp. YIM 152468]MDF1606876.1 hypothetical protein [Hoeflea sp. YIM 152468]